MKRLIWIFFLWSLKGFAANLESIDFSQRGDVSRLEFSFSSPQRDVERSVDAKNQQILLDFKGASAQEGALRGFDTSEFPGAIIYVSPYPVRGEEEGIRVIVQLKENVRSILRKGTTKVYLDVENHFGLFSDDDLRREGVILDQDAPVMTGGKKIHIPKSNSMDDILLNLTLSGQKKYVGKRISISVKDMNVEDILKLISDASGFNIITSQTNEIKGLPPLTLNLTNIPWDQVLDTILHLNNLVAQKNGSILTIKTLGQALEDKALETKAEKVELDLEPLMTKIFAISYASTDDLLPILKAYSTDQRGNIMVDKRINALIVKDTASTIEKMRKIIEVLDTQTPQVLIKAKIVEVTDRWDREIGFQNSDLSYDPIKKLGEEGETPTQPVESSEEGDGEKNAPPAAFSLNLIPGKTGKGSFFNIGIKNFLRLSALNFTLQLLETQSWAKIVASPEVVTLNKKKASLTTNDEHSYKKQTILQGADSDQAIVATDYASTSASLNLDVTPQVTNEGSISMKIKIQKEDFDVTEAEQKPNKKSRAVDTEVLVDNGATVVIGGIYNERKEESHHGIPFLKDLPLLGWLFRSPHNPTFNKTEMIIFITPRIINQKEAGFLDQG